MTRGTSANAVVPSTTEMDQSPLTSILPVISPRVLSPRASTPRFPSPRASTLRSSLPRFPLPRSSSSLPVSNNQYPQFLPEDWQEAYRYSNNPELAFSVGVYFTYNDQLLDMCAGLKQSVKAVLEGCTLRNCSADALAAIRASHQEMVDKVMDVLANQQHMQESQKRFGATLEAEIHVKNRSKDNCYTLFASLAALCGGSVFFVAKLHPKGLAVAAALFAAALSIAFIRSARLTDTKKDQLMIPVKKRKDIIEVIIGDNRLALCHLASIKSRANDLKSQIESIQRMEPDMRVTRLEALELGFQNLEREVDRCDMDAKFGRTGVVQTIIKNLD